MQIIKFRRGFATNSSSTHSIILAGSFSASESPYGHCNYGWEWFYIEEAEEKLRYMATQVYGSGTFPRGHWDDSDTKRDRTNLETREKIKDMLGVDIPDDAYVDHQSQMSFPATWDGSEINLEFIKELCESIANDPTIAIRGGNDNSDRRNTGEAHPVFRDADNHFPEPPWDKNISLMSRARKSNGVWVLYNTVSGTKTHLNLGPKITNPDKQYRPEFPELVDMKITDYCEKDCRFCYQNSSDEGQHAPTSRIINWMQTCKDAGVIELAIGGGEPTEHPDFIPILEEANKHFLAVNFSTRSRKWLRTKKKARQIGELVRAVGFSVSSRKEMEEVKKDWKRCFYEKKKQKGWVEKAKVKGTPELTFHMIPELMAPASVKAIIDSCDYNDTIVLLGKKDTGRGSSCKATRGMEGLKKAIEGASRWWYRSSLAVDTAFAADHGDLLKKWGIDPRLYYTDEGRYSLYYDAVNNQFGPSSYQPDHLKSATPYFEKDNVRAARSALSVQEMFNKVWAMRV